MKVPITEIFCSVQGEGLYCGQKQVFLRFAGCNLSCSYCDEPAALSGAGAFSLSAREAAAAVIGLARKESARAISLTGGEPLLRWKFIKELAPALKEAGLAVHLETNGTLYRELSEVKDFADAISMDVKLPSSTGQRSRWREHAAFLRAAPEKTFLKAVVTSETSISDVKKAADLAASVSKSIPFFIQPLTKRPGAAVRPPEEVFLREACCLCAARLSNVKLLAQQHPEWGVR